MNRYYEVLVNTARAMGTLAQKLNSQKAQPLLPGEKRLIRLAVFPRAQELLYHFAIEQRAPFYRLAMERAADERVANDLLLKFILGKDVHDIPPTHNLVEFARFVEDLKD